MLTDLTLEYAKSFLGTPYVWGGQSPQGADCSGFVIMVLQAEGLLPAKFDTNAQGLYNLFKDFKTVQNFRGCLVFYGKSKTKITHVGLCLDDKQMIESGGGNSTTVNLSEANKSGAHVRIRPITYRKDLVDVLKVKLK